MTGSRPLRVALAVFRLTPAGGLEQHAVRLAALLAERGCEVTMLSTRPPPALPPGVAFERVPARGRTNHGRLAAFAADAALVAAGRFDRAVAFHLVPGFDVLFCADPSRADVRGLRAALPRYRTYAALERSALDPKTGAGRVLCLSSHQLEAFAARHGGPRARFALLAPTVDRARIRASGRDPGLRAEARRRLGLPPLGAVWLWMGLQPKTKGLDRVLEALKGAGDTRLLVCGLAPDGRAGRSVLGLARRLGVADRVVWLGFADDDQLASAMAAADLLVHPSRADVTGTVILEALAAGLPVVTTAVCGYGEHVAEADAGIVLAEPFRQADLQHALAAATPAKLAAWSARAQAYAARDELYRGLDEAAALIIEAPPRR